MDFFGFAELFISIFSGLYIFLIIFDAFYDGITGLIQRRNAKKT